MEETPAGGVAVAFDTVCQVAGGTYIARARTEEDREVSGPEGMVRAHGSLGEYTLKRIFLTPDQEAAYYQGFANQTLWPLCHIAFERPIFDHSWFEGYREVNRIFAESIIESIDGKPLIWVNDYQLALVPSFLPQNEDTMIGLFWHIPWPTWEIFRILPYKREILTSLLCCNFIGFHRHYQMRNFLTACDRELGARIDYETNTVYVDGKRVRAASLPMGIDVDIIRDLLSRGTSRPGLLDLIRMTFGLDTGPEGESTASPEAETINDLAARYDLFLGVDRLDYSKGIKERLFALDRFFDCYPEYRERVVYIGIMSPTRTSIPAYAKLRDDVEALAEQINQRHQTEDWRPLHMVYNAYTREDVIDLYQKARVCLVTPVDDGMNLVSKEFVVAASCSDDPGMLVLSQFAGSASDLSAALLVNPYDTEAMATAMHAALTMDRDERRDRLASMVTRLEERNVYDWAISFVRNTIDAALAQRHEILQLG
jgi:trehalose 6-phosphate synthase